MLKLTILVITNHHWKKIVLWNHSSQNQFKFVTVNVQITNLSKSLKIK